MTHIPDAHLRGDLPYPIVENAIIHDAPRALLHVGKCVCGAVTVRPYEQALIDLMEREWGVRETVDQRALASVMRFAYDPVEREDVASGEVWAGAVA